MSAIKRIEYIPCGFCTNNRALLFRCTAPRKIRFAAGVFLIHHRREGYILYDTGYPLQIRKLRYLPYRLLNPVHMRPRDAIDKALQRRGISPSAVQHVILSHLHVDHIGGAALFPRATFYMTKETAAVWKNPSPRDFLFREFLPKDFEGRLRFLCSNMPPLHPARGEDLFGDKSLLVTVRGGHARGQALLYLPDFSLLLASDVCWGMPLLPLTNRMGHLARAIQNDFSLYKKNAACLEKWQREGMKIIVSHDQPGRIRRILDEIF